MSGGVTARRLAAATVGLTALAATSTTALAIALSQSSRSDPHSHLAFQGLPTLPAPAFEIPQPRSLTTSPSATRWAPVLHAVALRTSPAADATVIQQLGSETPEGTSNIVPVLGRAQDRQGEIWVRVRAPALPENREGWVPRAALGGYTLVHTRLVVELEHLRATLYADRRRVFRASIGIGTPSAPTPRGEFYVRNVLTAYRSPFYGPVAFGTSARSRVLTDWPAGGFIGIHGTDRPDLIPGRVSHGCIRMRNTDIARLAELMPVGTPVTIR